MAESTLTLSEACGPLFLFLTAFRRNASSSGMGIEALHRSLQREIEEARRRCDQDRRLSQLWDRVSYGLVTTADQVVLSSDWPQRAGWSMRLLEMQHFKTAEGGQKFFNLVDEILQDPSDDAAEAAGVLYTCVALGFQGQLMGQTRQLELLRRQLFDKARLSGKVGARLSPAAYERNLARRFGRLPAQGILRMLAIAVAALLFAYGLDKTIVLLRAKEHVTRVEDLVKDLHQDQIVRRTADQ